MKYILFGALPFNTILSLVVCIVTFIVYKPLHKFILNIAGANKEKTCEKVCNKQKLKLRITIEK